MSEPDLFVVCKNCSAEVSPYVTECPYCGQRVREPTPHATPLLIGLSLRARIFSASNNVTYYDLGALIFPIDGDWWRLAATPFLHGNLGYAVIARTATGIFGALLARGGGR